MFVDLVIIQNVRAEEARQATVDGKAGKESRFNASKSNDFDI